MLKHSRVLVTGGTGFLGGHVVSALEGQGAIVYSPFRGNEEFGVDLTDRGHVETMFANCLDAGPLDYVFHLAGFNGGIQFNLDAPADIFRRNTMMALNVLDACHRWGVQKVVSVVASCAYPAELMRHTEYQHETELMHEDIFLEDMPHPTVACHGYAKRNLQLVSQFYRQQYGLRAVCACPTTLYGPGDSYDPRRTKVMGGMVKRFVDAVDNGEQEVVCWGTGAPKREFLYVEDAAKLLLQVLEHYEDSTMPLNLGTGQELTVKEVAETVARGVMFFGRIGWDASRPDGQMRKRLDLTRMRETLPGVELTPLDEGIRRTAADYRARRDADGDGARDGRGRV